MFTGLLVFLGAPIFVLILIVRLIYGFYKDYAGMLDTVNKANIRRITVYNEDHYFSKSMEDFIQLPEKYLFY